MQLMKKRIICLDQAIQHEEAPVNTAIFFLLIRDIRVPLRFKVLSRAHM
jgi:hypothetical protein